MISACSRTRNDDGRRVATLYLTCGALSEGVRCRLLALSTDVSQPPRDVTSEAFWRLSGLPGARVSAEGTVDSSTDGDLEIRAEFERHDVRAWVRLARHHEGRTLAMVSGRVYAETRGRLSPVARARVEVVSGPNTGLSTTTLDDGSYEFVGVVPGDIALRAAKGGYVAGERSSRLNPGDNRLNVLIESVPPSAGSAS